MISQLFVWLVMYMFSILQRRTIKETSFYCSIHKNTLCWLWKLCTNIKLITVSRFNSIQIQFETKKSNWRSTVKSVPSLHYCRSITCMLNEICGNVLYFVYIRTFFCSNKLVWRTFIAQFSRQTIFFFFLYLLSRHTYRDLRALLSSSHHIA